MGSRCRFLPLAQVYPTAIPHLARHLRRLAPAKCSGDRRARVSGPSEGRVPLEEARKPHRGVHAPLTRMPTAFPSSAARGHPLSPARRTKEEETSPDLSDRPRPSFRRNPAKGGAIQKTEVPSTVANSEACGGSLPRLPRRPSRSRRPHVFPRLRERAFRGALQALVRASPLELSRARAPLSPAGKVRAWD